MKHRIAKWSLLCLLPAALFSCQSTSATTGPSAGTSNSTEEAPSSVDILAGGISVGEVDILKGETASLTTSLLPEGLDIDFQWTSSDSTIATVSATGTVEGVDEGTAIITVTAVDYPYVTDSIFVNVSLPVEQTGIGSGLTPDDPIFKGNAGDENIEVYFLEMQHIYSDSIFIKSGNVEVLIDSGYAYDGTYIDSFLDTHMTDGRLDLLMLSHSDGDHIEGLENALQNVDNISMMIDYGGRNTGNVGQIREKYIEKGMTYHSAYDCVNFIDGANDRYYLTEDLTIDILDTGNYVTAEESGAGNANSVACIFTYKDEFRFFTGGDLTSGSEADLLKNEDLPQVTLFKAHHHGSHGSNSQEFLNTINPKAVAISAARADRYGTTPGPASPNNTYNLDGTSGHPAEEAIGRFYKAPRISQNLNVYWNAVNGTMKFTSEGDDDFTFQGSATMKGYYDLTLTDGVPVWDDSINDFKNKVTGEENKKLHETKVFQFRNYVPLLPQWAQDEYFPEA